MNQTSLLSIRNASKLYTGVPALQEASLELAVGEVHGLMGENGAGKSTLIKILAGAVSPDSIDLALDGQPIHIRSAGDAFAHGFRFIHQELNVVPRLSVAENIFLGQPYPKWLGAFVDWPTLNRAATSTLARLGIEHINPKQKIARLSLGDQMLVKIASTLLSSALHPARNTSNNAEYAPDRAPDKSPEARLYVMDEPTASLTGQESERLFTVIQQLKAQGCCVLYVSHRMDEVLRICDRITVMRDGKVITTKENPLQENLEPAKREIIHLMTGRDMQQAYPPAQPRTQKGAGSSTTEDTTEDATEKVLLDVRKLATDALHELSFQLHEGEILGVAGLAGSGQSTLLRALMGADAQRERDVWLDGESQGKLDPAAAWMNNLAYVPRERRSQGLILSHSIRDNVTLPHLRGLSYGGIFLNRGQEQRRTQSLGNQVSLKATGPSQRSYQLSGGNQQKVVFARALANAPKLLLLDEPTRGVDVGAKYDIYTLIRNLSAQGAAVILASTDLSELLGMCDCILVMVEHRLFTIVETDGLTQEDLLTLCYGTGRE